MTMKTYHGYRQMERGHDGTIISSRCVVQVVVNGRRRALRPRNDIRDHSPTGFEWGYGGSGPAQLGPRGRLLRRVDGGPDDLPAGEAFDCGFAT